MISLLFHNPSMANDGWTQEEIGEVIGVSQNNSRGFSDDISRTGKNVKMRVFPELEKTTQNTNMSRNGKTCQKLNNFPESQKSLKVVKISSFRQTDKK